MGRGSKLKTATGSAQSLVGAGTDAPERQLLSVLVTVDRDVTAGSLVVLDKSAVLSAYGNLLVARSEDFYFSSDSVAIRATWRFGAVVADAARVVTIDVAA